MSSSTFTMSRGAEYFLNLSAAYAAAAYIPSIVMERGLFCREISDGLHRSALQNQFTLTPALTMSS